MWTNRHWSRLSESRNARVPYRLRRREGDTSLLWYIHCLVFREQPVWIRARRYFWDLLFQALQRVLRTSPLPQFSRLRVLYPLCRPTIRSLFQNSDFLTGSWRSSLFYRSFPRRPKPLRRLYSRSIFRLRNLLLHLVFGSFYFYLSTRRILFPTLAQCLRLRQACSRRREKMACVCRQLSLRTLPFRSLRLLFYWLMRRRWHFPFSTARYFSRKILFSKDILRLKVAIYRFRLTMPILAIRFVLCLFLYYFLAPFLYLIAGHQTRLCLLLRRGRFRSSGLLLLLGWLLQILFFSSQMNLCFGLYVYFFSLRGYKSLRALLRFRRAPSR